MKHDVDHAEELNTSTLVSHVEVGGSPAHGRATKRDLKSRHAKMIALGAPWALVFCWCWTDPLPERSLIPPLLRVGRSDKWALWPQNIDLHSGLDKLIAIESPPPPLQSGIRCGECCLSSQTNYMSSI